jgi:PAS domain S-box-containing protein
MKRKKLPAPALSTIELPGLNSEKVRSYRAAFEAMNRLHELSTRLLEATGLGELLEEILEATIALQHADFGNVQLYNRQTQALEIVAQRGFGPEFLNYLRAVPEGLGSCGLALQRRQRVIIEDTETNPAFAPCRAAAASAGYRAVQSTPMFSRDGKPLGMLSTHFRQPHRPSERDLRLTDLYVQQAAGLIERKQAEEALQQSEERLRFAAQAAGFGIYELNFVTGQAYRSPDYKALFGLQPNDEFQLDADQVPIYVHPDDRALLRNVTRESRDPRGEGAKDVEYRVVLPDGAVRWLLVRGRTFFEGEGKARRLVLSRGIALDVTERKQLEQEILEISGREQRRISQDLHDGLCQQLAGIEFRNSVLVQQLAQDQKAKAEAVRIGTLIRDVTSQTRLLAKGLSPVSLEANGFMSALEELTSNVSKLFNISCGFKCPRPVLLADNTVATHLYRIAQEAITNAVKHGRAKSIVVSLNSSGDESTLTITDDGSGFPVGASATGGLGLRIMKYRAEMIGASLRIRPADSKGTTVACSFRINR